MKTRIYLLRKVGHLSVKMTWNLQMQQCAASPFLNTLQTSSARSTHRILHNVIQYVLISESTMLPLSNLITEMTNNNVEESTTPTVTLIGSKITHQVGIWNTPGP